MFRSRVTLEEYLKSVQHEDAVGEDVSLDDIDMTPDLEEEEIETVGENIFESRVSIDMNPSLITIPDDFKDDKEVSIIDEHGSARRLGGRINVNMAYKLVPPERIMGKFLLPDGVQVNQKILKSVGKRVRGFKYSLRCKYVKEDATKEALYNLGKSKRPSAVGDQMWVGLVDYFFSKKFQIWSTNGKRARGKQLHAHTSGSQNFAIKRDNFEKEHQREPGPLEWFMETHRDKEGSYHEAATKKFLDVAVDIVKRKTGASEVVLCEATVPAETFAYHKLMGPESSGRVRGVGSGVTSNQLNAKHNCQSDTEHSDSSRGDNVEENQRINTPLADEHIRNTLETTPTLAKNNEAPVKDACQIENPIVLRDKGGAAHTSRSPQVQNQVSQQRRSVRGKKNI